MDKGEKDMNLRKIAHALKENDLLVILGINLLMWIVVIFANFVYFYKTDQYTELSPILAGGVITSILAINKAWKLK